MLNNRILLSSELRKYEIIANGNGIFFLFYELFLNFTLLTVVFLILTIRFYFLNKIRKDIKYTNSLIVHIVWMQ